jgi:hypothetical protein
MNIPTLPKHWKVEKRSAYMDWGNGKTYPRPYEVGVIVNPKGKIVLVIRPNYNALYEESGVEMLTEFEFLKDYAWEPK